MITRNVRSTKRGLTHADNHITATVIPLCFCSTTLVLFLYFCLFLFCTVPSTYFLPIMFKALCLYFSFFCIVPLILFASICSSVDLHILEFLYLSYWLQHHFIFLLLNKRSFRQCLRFFFLSLLNTWPYIFILKCYITRNK